MAIKERCLALAALMLLASSAYADPTSLRVNVVLPSQHGWDLSDPEAGIRIYRNETFSFMTFLGWTDREDGYYEAQFQTALGTETYESGLQLHILKQSTKWELQIMVQDPFVRTIPDPDDATRCTVEVWMPATVLQKGGAGSTSRLIGPQFQGPDFLKENISEPVPGFNCNNDDPAINPLYDPFLCDHDDDGIVDLCDQDSPNYDPIFCDADCDGTIDICDPDSGAYDVTRCDCDCDFICDICDVDSPAYDHAQCQAVGCDNLNKVCPTGQNASGYGPDGEFCGHFPELPRACAGENPDPPDPPEDPPDPGGGGTGGGGVPGGGEGPGGVDPGGGDVGTGDPGGGTVPPWDPPYPPPTDPPPPPSGDPCCDMIIFWLERIDAGVWSIWEETAWSRHHLDFIHSHAVNFRREDWPMFTSDFNQKWTLLLDEFNQTQQQLGSIHQLVEALLSLDILTEVPQGTMPGTFRGDTVVINEFLGEHEPGLIMNSMYGVKDDAEGIYSDRLEQLKPEYVGSYDLNNTDTEYPAEAWGDSVDFSVNTTDFDSPFGDTHSFDLSIPFRVDWTAWQAHFDPLRPLIIFLVNAMCALRTFLLVWDELQKR